MKKATPTHRVTSYQNQTYLPDNAISLLGVKLLFVHTFFKISLIAFEFVHTYFSMNEVVSLLCCENIGLYLKVKEVKQKVKQLLFVFIGIIKAKNKLLLKKNN